MEMVIEHGVEYVVDTPVAIEDLIQSLDAHARLLRNSTKLISSIIPGLTIETKQVSVKILSQQSPLKEIFALAVVVGYQKDLEGEVPALVEQLTGLTISDKHDTLITVLVMLIAIYGISKAFELLFPSRPKDNLESARDSLVKKAARITGATAGRIIAAVEVLFTGRTERTLVTASQKVFAPTRNQADATIRDNRGDELIGVLAVRDAQAASGLPYEPGDTGKSKTESKLHTGARIVLHAMDRDRKRLGWAGHCPDIFDDRIPMHLEKSLAPKEIFGRDEIRGDILLTLEENDEGDMVPKEFLLLRLHL